MPGLLLTSGTVILCSHGGQATSPAPCPRVKVMGQPILLQTVPMVIAGCANPPPPVNIGPCVTATWLVGALRVKALGQPVLLADSQSMGTPTPAPLNIVPTQMRVKGM